MEVVFKGSHKEVIKCPNCSKEQVAIVKHTWPFFTYIHDCEYCNYTIMESEWNNTDTTNEWNNTNNNG
jgi:DNA-directed RNA polymerase subunit RPC12/RpoP